MLSPFLCSDVLQRILDADLQLRIVRLLQHPLQELAALLGAGHLTDQPAVPGGGRNLAVLVGDVHDGEPVAQVHALQLVSSCRQIGRTVVGSLTDAAQIADFIIKLLLVLAAGCAGTVQRPGNAAAALLRQADPVDGGLVVHFADGVYFIAIAVAGSRRLQHILGVIQNRAVVVQGDFPGSLRVALIVVLHLLYGGVARHIGGMDLDTGHRRVLGHLVREDVDMVV